MNYFWVCRSLPLLENKKQTKTKQKQLCALIASLMIMLVTTAHRRPIISLTAALLK